MRPHVTALLFLGALATGCVSGDEDVPIVDYDAIEAAIGVPIDPDHDHGDPSLHEGSHNLELVALVRGEEGRQRLPTEFYAETAVKDGYAYLTRYGPEQGLVIFDAAD
ncbi:MAG: hypothetical protein ACRDH5_10920, partial [bacterium]